MVLAIGIICVSCDVPNEIENSATPTETVGQASSPEKQTEKPEETNSNTVPKHTEEEAVNLVAEKYYENSKEDLQVVTYNENMYVVSLAIDAGSGLFSTLNAFLVVEGNIIAELMDEDGNFDKGFWDKVKQAETLNNEKNMLSDDLYMKNENLAYSFSFPDGKKASVCFSSNEEYIVFRLGTKNEIELEYPNLEEYKDNLSQTWLLFDCEKYTRIGGVENEGMTLNYLRFEDRENNYELYFEYFAGDSETIGLRITNKITEEMQDISGVFESERGMWFNIVDNPKLEEAVG